MSASTTTEPPRSKVILKLNSPDGDTIREISSAPPRPCTDGEIPFIDLSGLYEGDFKDLQRIASEVKSAAETSGVFYIKNHGVSREIIEEARLKSLEYYEALDQMGENEANVLADFSANHMRRNGKSNEATSNTTTAGQHPGMPEQTRANP